MYIKTDNKWFDGYEGESIIYLNDLGKGSDITTLLKLWLDKYPSKAEVKGGYVDLRHLLFIISS